VEESLLELLVLPVPVIGVALFVPSDWPVAKC